ncbi:MAG: hypothetical protein RL417_528 [Pseudomonadota bacterium]|jgi:hypothetical protein
MIRSCVLSVVLLLGSSLPGYAAGPGEEQPFLPTWKLLNSEQKQQFIAGYLFGWNDAAQITSIVAGFVKENPEQAQRGLEKLQSLYDVGDLKPGAIAREVDNFFNDPSNTAAGLSRAVSFAKERLK